LVGVGLNAPYIWTRSEEDREEFFSFLNKIDSQMFRINPENDKHILQPTLDELNTNTCDLLKDFLKTVPSDTKVIIPVIDGYELFAFDKWNPIYGRKNSFSPYLTDTSSPQALFKSRINFFKDQKLKDAYKMRAKFFIELAKEFPNVILEIGNEVESPLKGRNGINLNTAWYEEMFEFYRDEGYDGPLLTGLRDPNLIDNDKFFKKPGFVNTLHHYLGAIENLPKTPIFLEEIGFPNKLFGIKVPDVDKILTNFIINTLKASVRDGIYRIYGVMVWQADKKHKDNFNFDKEIFPQTTALLSYLSPKLKQLFLNS
jgi:hypothetical protein